MTSHVYIVLSDETRAVLKILTPLGIKDEAVGAAALRHFDGHGAVRLLQADEGAHLMEYADGNALTVQVAQGDDDSATRIIADVLNQLHAAPPALSIAAFTPLSIWFHSLFNKATLDGGRNINSVYVCAARIAHTLLTSPQNVCVLHGDIHHANIKQHHARGWLTFDPKGLYGERAYDAANTLLNPMDMPAFVQDEARLLRRVDILAEQLGIDRARLLHYGFAHACLSASWSLEDSENANHALHMASLIEPHLRPLEQ